MSSESRIVPKTQVPKDLDTASNSYLESMIENAMDIVDSELIRYKNKASSGVFLDIKEARIVQGYMESLIKLSREMRESVKNSDFAEMSDGELARLASDVLVENKTRKSVHKNLGKESEGEWALKRKSI